jgi:3'-5' exonuclease
MEQNSRTPAPPRTTQTCFFCPPAPESVPFEQRRKRIVDLRRQIDDSGLIVVPNVYNTAPARPPTSIASSRASLVGKPDADIRQALGNKFPKHIYHTIVCIGALVAHRESDHWAVDALGAPHVGERTEKQLISAFCDKIAELKPQLVTFNGNSFDLPVLRYRAMIHGVSAPGLAARLYFNRYTEDAVDLCDILSSFAPHTKASLNELSKIMGLPGKPEGIDGAEVERYFLEGKIKEIADYCETDVVNTYRVWLRYELFRGRLSESEHQASEHCLAAFIAARVSTKVYLNRLDEGRST